MIFYRDDINLLYELCFIEREEFISKISMYLLIVGMYKLNVFGWDGFGVKV